MKVLVYQIEQPFKPFKKKSYMEASHKSMKDLKSKINHVHIIENLTMLPIIRTINFIFIKIKFVID